MDNNISWLYDNLDGLREKIIFRNRIEYKVNGEFHNVYGPSIIYTYDPLHKTNPSDEESNVYYIKGLKLSKEQWLINTRKFRLKKLIKKIRNDIK